MFHRILSAVSVAVMFGLVAASAQDRPGPWQNDVHIYRAAREPERLATFPRAGVSTLARLKDGRIAAAFQNFPANDRQNFDRVAIAFSSDEGRTWTTARTVVVTGMEPGLMRPFDPTLVPLPDGRVRLYFTSNRSSDFRRSIPAIYSAISSNGIDYSAEPGVRFGVEDRVVIDCAVVLHRGVYHLFAPDNGSAAEFRAAEERRAPPPAGGAYHASSSDGLTFVRMPDLRLESFHWLGNAQSDGDVIRFFGTSRNRMSATSTNGADWTVDESFPAVPGADPGAVKLKDGAWLIAVTGPPRDERRGPGMAGERPRPALMNALDANQDEVLDQREIENATSALKRLDRNNDGRITGEELRRPLP